VLVGVAFAEPTSYVNEFNQMVLFWSFALAGIALAGLNAVHPRRPFAILFFTYALIVAASYLTPQSPLGNNVGRFAMVFGVSLLLLLRNDRLRRLFGVVPLSTIPIVLFALLGLSSAYHHYTNHSDHRATEAGYFAPALATAERLHDPLEVARAGHDARGDHALRRHQVDEVEDELLAGVGDPQQVRVAPLELFVADLDVDARLGRLRLAHVSLLGRRRTRPSNPQRCSGK